MQKLNEEPRERASWSERASVKFTIRRPRQGYLGVLEQLLVPPPFPPPRAPEIPKIFRRGGEVAEGHGAGNSEESYEFLEFSGTESFKWEIEKSSRKNQYFGESSKKSSMKLTLNKKSHTEIAFCVCQDPRFTLLIGPRRKNKKFDF